MKTVELLSHQLGKMPPQALEIEEVVLGALMLERDALDIVVEILKSDSFYKEAHQEIYKAILDLFSNNEPIDIKTVTHQLRRNGKLESVGGAYYISQLTAKVNSAANIETHARIIAEQSIKRELIRISSEVQHDAYEDTKDVFKLLDKAATDIENVTMTTSGLAITGMNHLFTEVVDSAISAKNARETNTFTGVPSGILALDRVTGGFKESDLVIIAARPGMGKTAMVTTILRNCGIGLDIPVGMLSMEMSSLQIGQRIASAEAEVPLESLRNGTLQDYELERLNQYSNRIMGGKIYIDDSSALTPFEIKTKARMMQRKFGIRMLMVDYLQLAQVPNSKSRENEIGVISRALKATAKDLNIPVIALSQLSRAVEQRGGEKKPMLSDLRDSGSIEQDADMVIFLYRPEYYGITEIEFEGSGGGMSSSGLGEIIIAKHRNGAIDTKWASFIGKYTKWDDIGSTPKSTWSPLPQERDEPF